MIFPGPMVINSSLVSSLSHSKATIPFLILISPAVTQEMFPHSSREFGGPTATLVELQAEIVDDPSSEFLPPAMLQGYIIPIEQSHSLTFSPMQQGEPS
jgi:hypothetical protein